MSSPSASADARDRLYQMIGGYRVSQLIRAAARLGICDSLADGPRDAPAVAADAGADPALVRRLMRALTALGVLVEGQDRRFANTELGRLLTRDAPGSVRDTSLGLTDDAQWEAWERLPDGIAQGLVPMELAHGRPYWDVLKQDPAVSDRFNRFMVAQTQGFVPQLLAAFDFSSAGRIVDVGGGNGALAAGILAAHPTLRATLFDLEPGLEGAHEYLGARGVSERCDLVIGSFFDEVPGGGDVYLLSRILHDWHDGKAAEILAACRRAMRPGATLLVMDQVLPDRAVAGPRERNALISDMHMYVLFGARERSERELREMLGSVGFEVQQIVPATPMSVVVSRAV